MIDTDTISGIIATYQKHGWILRRVLLSAELKKHLGKQVELLFNGINLVDSNIDAAWFSRPPKSGGVAWEIRYLGNIPLALLEKADEEDPVFENSLKSVESRLREIVGAKQTA
jgi:hypothetical protein